jgi:hypothetical protein
MRELFLLTAGSKQKSIELAQAAAQLGYKMECANVAEDIAEWETPRDVEEIFRDMARAAASFPSPPAAVINFGRSSVPDGIRRIAQATERLLEAGVVTATTKIIGPSERAAAVWGNKDLIADSLQLLDLPIPETARITAESAAALASEIEAREHHGALIVKVVDFSCGVGMRYVESPGDLVATVRDLSYLNRPMIVTRFVHGDEVSVDILRLGTDMIVYPPGFKRATDALLTHADHKVKVNGVVREIPEFTRDIIRIAEEFDLQGFFSLEAVITSTAPMSWQILEGATRVTNNIQLQDASLGIDSYSAVARYIAGEPWLPQTERLGMALSIPIYTHLGRESVQALSGYEWTRQIKLENLGELPDSRDQRVRLTVKMAVEDLDEQLHLISAATGDSEVTSRVKAEIKRVEAKYGSRRAAPLSERN